MQEEQISTKDLITMANQFSGCKLDPKYFPVMFHSSLIIEALSQIYILQRNNQLSKEDNLKIKQVFHHYFKFFAKKFSVKYLILSLIFSSLIVFSGVAAFFVSFFFVPFILIFIASLILTACLIKIQTYPIRVTGIHDNFRHELFALKYNLNNLKNSLLDKYQIKTCNDFPVNSDMPADLSESENSQNEKKAVSFALKLSVFFEESYEPRSRANSYENNISCRFG